MPAQTSQGLPYPIGTDRVQDGDNAIQALAQWLDNSLCFGSAYTSSTGPGVGGTMWFNTQPIALTGGCTIAGTIPVFGIRVPRKGWYDLRAIGNIQASATGCTGRLFIGDGTNVWCQGYTPIAAANTYHTFSCGIVRQLAANQVVYWGMTSAGPQAVGIYGDSQMNNLLVRLLLPLP